MRTQIDEKEKFEDLEGEKFGKTLNLVNSRFFSIQCIVTANKVLDDGRLAQVRAEAVLQKSNDGENWTDIKETTEVLDVGSHWFEVVDPTYKFARVSYNVMSGQLTIESKILARGCE